MSLTSFMTEYLMNRVAAMNVDGVDMVSAFKHGYYSAMTPKERMMEYRKDVAEFTFQTRCRWIAACEGEDPFGPDVVPKYDVTSDDSESECAFVFSIPGEAYPMIIFVGNDFSAFDKMFEANKDDMHFRELFDDIITDKRDELHEKYGDMLHDELEKHTKFYFIRSDSFYDENTIQEFDVKTLNLDDDCSEADVHKKITGYYLEHNGYKEDDYGFLHDPAKKNEVVGYVASVRHDDWQQASMSIIRDYGLAKDKLDMLKGRYVLKEETPEEICEKKGLVNLCTAMQNVSYSMGIRHAEKEKVNFKEWLQTLNYGLPETYYKKDFGVRAGNIDVDMAYINIPSEHLPFLRSSFGVENRPSYYFMNQESHEYGPLQLKILQVVNPSEDTPLNKTRTFTLYDPVMKQELDMAGNISFDRHMKEEYLKGLYQFINLQDSIDKDRPKYSKMLKEYRLSQPEAELVVEKEDYGYGD